MGQRRDVRTLHVRRARHAMPDVQRERPAAAVPGPSGVKRADRLAPSVRDLDMRHLDRWPAEPLDPHRREPQAAREADRDNAYKKFNAWKADKDKAGRKARTNKETAA
jgi:hypothetical protein